MIYNFEIFNEKFYSEYKSYFTHNGEKFNLNKLLRLSDKNSIFKVNVDICKIKN
jgi:hypothetical protein